mgnify:FL=1
MSNQDSQSKFDGLNNISIKLRIHPLVTYLKICSHWCFSELINLFTSIGLKAHCLKLVQSNYSFIKFESAGIKARKLFSIYNNSQI